MNDEEGGGRAAAQPILPPSGEMVDVVDDDDRVIDTVPRSVMRAHRLQHRAVFIAVFDSDGRLLIHQRSASKDLWPGWWDIAVGGVVAAGEGYDEAARRELREEIGLADADIRPLDATRPRRFVDRDVALIGRVYAAQVEAGQALTFADGEVVAAEWVTRERLSTILAERSFLPDSLALVLPLLD